MNPTIQDKRQPLPSILTVYRPIEEYWDSFGPADGLSPGPSEVLEPFDAFLVHRVLELVPGLPILVDAALAGTGGASSLIGLAHPHVRGVWAVAERGSLASERALSALRGYVRSRGSGLAPLEVIARSDLLSGLADQPGVVILVDARVADAAALAEEVGRWLDERPDALVLVLGLGRVGECPAVASLLPLCSPDSPRRLWLLRELGEVLMASHMGVVARHDHPHVADVLLRVQQYYNGNYRYLDLLRQVNQEALRAAQIDADVMRHHPLSWALSGEIEELKRSAREAKEQAVAAAQVLAARDAELQEVWRALHEAREQLAAIPPVPPSVLVRVRRKLAPTPLGMAWRLAKRVARACLDWGRWRNRPTSAVGGR
jgi:hypothetical protein